MAVPVARTVVLSSLMTLQLDIAVGKELYPNVRLICQVTCAKLLALEQICFLRGKLTFSN